MPTLFKHQQDAIKKYSENNCKQAYYHDVGVGKTLSALKSFELHNTFIPCKLLVICPLSLIESSWADDIKKFTDFNYVNWNESKKYSTAQIQLINPESFITKKKQEWVTQLLMDHEVMCVLDESQKIKNYKAQITKKLLNFRNEFCSKLVMSATPAPNDDSEYWAQMCFLDDEIFGANYFKFRYYFFHLARGNTSISVQGLKSSDSFELMKRGFKFVLREDRREQFYNRMEPYVHFIKKEDVLDLPEQTDVIRYVKLKPDMMKIYKSMEKKLKTELQGEDVVALNALSKLTRLRQLISGFSKSDLGEIVRHHESVKIKELKDILEEIGDKQVMIFAEYHEEIDQIQDICKGAMLDGRTKDKQESIKAFQNKDVQYLVCHPKSGGVGLSFNDCDYCLFYSISYSSENYIQAKGRIHRANKKNVATYIHLIARDTLDELILSCVRDKKTQMDLIEEFLK
jgi:SNF2 family DNA or RNA helicase